MRIIVFALCILPCLAQEQEGELFRRPGKLKRENQISEISAYALGAAGEKTFLAQMEKVSNWFASTGVMTNPKGMDGWIAAFLDATESACGKRGCKSLPPKATIRAASIYDNLGDDGQVRRGNASANAWIRINDPNELEVMRGFGDQRVFGLNDTRGNRILTMPPQSRELGGFPVYGEKYIVIANPARVLFQPVSREEYIRSLIAQKQADARNVTENNVEAQRKMQNLSKDMERSLAQQRAAIAQLRNINPAAAAEAEKVLAEVARQARQDQPSLVEESRAAEPGIKLFRSALQAEIEGFERYLAKLTPQERASQAWISAADEENPTGLAAANSGAAQPAVIYNNDYFDPKRRAQIQLVFITLQWNLFDPANGGTIDGIDATHAGDYRLKQLVQQVDWKQLGALITASTI